MAAVHRHRPSARRGARKIPRCAIRANLPAPIRASTRHIGTLTLHQRAGAELWIIDLDARLVERWTADDQRPEILTDHIEWTGPGAPEALVVRIGDLFAAAHGER